MQRQSDIDRKKDDPPNRKGWHDTVTETETLDATLFVF